MQHCCNQLLLAGRCARQNMLQLLGAVVNSCFCADQDENRGSLIPGSPTNCLNGVVVCSPSHPWPADLDETLENLILDQLDVGGITNFLPFHLAHRSR